MAAASTPHPQTLTVHGTTIDISYEDRQGNTEITLRPRGQAWNGEQLREAVQGFCNQAMTNNAQAQTRVIGEQVTATFQGIPAEMLQQQQTKLQNYLEDHLPKGKATATS